MRNHRARWAAIGAAVAVSIGAGGLITLASAAGGTASTFTPITPCRLLDTRAGAATGATPPRSAPLGQGDAITIPARGNFGKCEALSPSATGAVLNVTIVNPTAGSFLTVWPADKDRPLASSLNWTAGQAATPNQVTTALDASGQFSIFNNGGSVDVIVDVVGLFEPAGAIGGNAVGPAGPAGPSGPSGPTGPAGPAGASGTGAQMMTAAEPAGATSGEFSSIVLDGSGNPVISHYDSTHQALLLTHCNDPACSPGGDVTNVVDDGGGNDVGQYSSLALDAGVPVISYYDSTAGNLKVARCNDADCASATINVADAAANDVGYYSSLALNGHNPVISYYDADAGMLDLVWCDDPACVPAGNVRSVVDNGAGEDVGTSSSLALDGNGLPIISYYNLTTDTIELAHCITADCAGNQAVVNPVVTTAGVVLQEADLVLASGNPVISFLNVTSQLAVATCQDAFCAGKTIHTIDSSIGEPAYSSIVLGAGGFPVVSYFDSGVGPLKVARCTDANRTVPIIRSTAGNTGDSGEFSSITLDSSGNPIISSHDIVTDSLMVTRCVDPFCNPKRIRTINP